MYSKLKPFLFFLLGGLLRTSVTSALETDDNRMIAYLGNWQSCPTAAQLNEYTHIVIAFAVSYTWSPGKNNCSPTCQIANPPICNNAPRPDLVNAWRAQGKKVILSFGGAGMGGSWAGDNNDCWEYCFGRETQVVNRLVDIVNQNNFDGVDIDYEYFYANNQNGSGFSKGAQAIKFLKDVTVGLRNNLPQGSIVTHAPMDADMVKGTAYYNMLKSISHTMDFIMPQYYNGYTRPAIDGFAGSGAGQISAKGHYDTIVDEFFNGDATRMVFGFCISDCGGTGSNANGPQAKSVIKQVASSYECQGGAFFWVAEKDYNAGWSKVVNEGMSNRGCSGDGGPQDPPGPTNPPAPTTAPKTSPPAPTDPPAPPSADGKCCAPGQTAYKSMGDCTQFYFCQNGVVTGNTINCPASLLFDEGLQVCNWAAQVTCNSDNCGGVGGGGGDPEPTEPPVQPPTDPPTNSFSCKNDKWYRDTDCDKATHGGKKVCVKDNNREPKMHSTETGTKCATCVDLNNPTKKDRGCPKTKPRCVKKDGSNPGELLAGDKCVA